MVAVGGTPVSVAPGGAAMVNVGSGGSLVSLGSAAVSGNGEGVVGPATMHADVIASKTNMDIICIDLMALSSL